MGKGTQCAKLVEDFNLEHISVGDLLRNEKDDPDSVFGEFLQESMQNSVIVPPSLTTMLLKDKIQEIQSRGNNVLIDGFPRSIEQAKAFEAEVCTHVYDVILKTVAYTRADYQSLYNHLFKLQSRGHGRASHEAL